MEIGRTDEMYVFAEVPEEDVHRLKLGASATISGGGLDSPLYGTVEQVGMKVAKSDVLHLDPAALTDTRVVEAKIRLNESSRAAALIHAQVNVVITP
jgi:HlyD family secretion protein